MALTRLKIDGYGQLEINNAAFRRDGRIVAQYKLDPSLEAIENGMILAVDPVAKTVKLPTTSDKLLALNYSAEHTYEDRKSGLKNFRIEKGSVLPRLGYPDVGDIITTNTIAYDSTADSTWTSDEAVKTAVKAAKATPVYGKPCANGAIQLTATAPDSGLTFKVVEPTTMPDGQYGIKLVCVAR